jgi:hypothetical protein
MQAALLPCGSGWQLVRCACHGRNQQHSMLARLHSGCTSSAWTRGAQTRSKLRLVSQGLTGIQLLQPMQCIAGFMNSCLHWQQNGFACW